jgi:hypothetical protein
MFATALKLVSKFTYPVIISKRLYDGTVQCGCATFIVLNPEGWILTAAHVIRDLLLADAHAVEITQYKDQLAAIEANPKLSKNQKGLAIRGQRVNSQWIANCAYWWGFEGKKLKPIITITWLTSPSGDLYRFTEVKSLFIQHSKIRLMSC